MDIIPLHKKAANTTKKTIDKSTFYRHYQKYLKLQILERIITTHNRQYIQIENKKSIQLTTNFWCLYC